ncbi:glycosyl hydrolase [Rahnella aquatilis]|nr:glycoside hydrolase N-terminal domain-containing protein [Rahnella aquatilis]RBQ34835.1 glycosyl hydrolase [Rahnella aquatilis]
MSKKPENIKMWAATPAVNWESEAYPIGNARLGAMLFSDPLRDQIQFNENSLWGGLNNYDSQNYDTSVTGFGSYLNFGNLHISFVEEAEVTYESPHGTMSANETVDKSVDGNKSTKWCIASPGNSVIWQAKNEEEKSIASYTLTSANDTPERDPSRWIFSASHDALSWIALDERTSVVFEQRLMSKTFTFINTVPYLYYRFEFIPIQGVSHFQVAEISLPDIILRPQTACYLTSPSGDSLGSRTGGQGIIHCCDGDVKTKWCVEAPADEVIWEIQFPTATLFTSYELTSANDYPERDPRYWTLSASNDGEIWTVLDAQPLDVHFTERLQTKTFPITNTQPWTFYRLTFSDTQLATHFQIAEINLKGVEIDLRNYISIADYRRETDMITGVHTTTYALGNNLITRECFASHAEDIIVLHYSSNNPGAFSGKLKLISGQETNTLSSGDKLTFSGILPNNLRYAAGIKVTHQGGQLTTQDNHIIVLNCDSLTIFMDARTDFAANFETNWRNGEDPAAKVASHLAQTSTVDFNSLRSRHIEDFSSLMERVIVDWGTTDEQVKSLPTSRRLLRYATSHNDPELEQMLFYYGRYLLVSASRAGGLPANLQGLWNNSNTPAWASDYHNNINIQMNYWPAEVANLSECHVPLMDFIVNSRTSCRMATQKQFGADIPGWTARTSQSVFGGNGWDWNVVASAWYMQHVAEHYAFTQDVTFLRDTGYPLIKEICQFWQARLILRNDGKLVSPKGWSPEHGPVEDGVMYDQQIIWDLFQHYLDAEDILNLDPQYRATIASLQANLAPNLIGSWGQLQEWQEDIDDPNDTHRHTSHLFAVFPGRQIIAGRDQDFADAAMVSLKARCNEKEGVPFTAATVVGDSRRSWTWPWRAALFARLQDGERAGIMLQGLLTYNTLPNLFTNHPPFQIDGNYGITAAICEMLLQSVGNGEWDNINVIPAIPDAWKKKGSFSGLCARGGYTIDCEWNNAQQSLIKTGRKKRLE